MSAGYRFSGILMTVEQKTPKALAGAPGGRNGSAAQREQPRPYPRVVSPARLRLRTVTNDDGHFQGFEVIS